MRKLLKQKKGYISLLLIFTLLTQMLLPIFRSGVIAAEEKNVELSKYFSISQRIVNGSDEDVISIEPGDSISVILDYQISVPSNGTLTDVELSYKIPEEIDFDVVSGHEYRDITPDAEGKIVLQFNNGAPITEGLTGSIEIQLSIPEISVKPNETEILFDKAIFTGDYEKDGSNSNESKDSNIIKLPLVIGPSWQISKSVDNSISIIPKDTSSKTHLDATYTITLSGGNVSLNNVILEDEIKQIEDDSYVNGIIIKDINGATYTQDENKIIFDAGTLTAGSSKTITYTISYPVDEISEGEYLNTIWVKEASFPYDSSDGLIYFIGDRTASASKIFNYSTAYWEVFRDEPENTWNADRYAKEVVIPKVTSIDRKQVSYTVGVRSVGEENGDLGEIKLIEQLPPEASFVPAVLGGDQTEDGGIYDSGTHTVTWTLSNVTAGTAHEKTVTVEYMINRDDVQDPHEVWVGKQGVINVLTYETTANTSSYIEIKLREENNILKNKVQTEFIESTEYWYIEKYTSPSTFDLRNEDKSSSVTDFIEYTIRLVPSSSINNLDIESATVVDHLPDYVDYSSIVCDPAGLINKDDRTITWNLTNISATQGKELKVKLKFKKDMTDKDGSIIGVIPGTDLQNTASLENVIPDKLFINYKNGDIATDTATVTTRFRKPDAPNPTIDINVSGYNKKSNKVITEKNFNHNEAIEYEINFSNPSTDNDYDDIKNVIIELGNDASGKDYKVLSDKINYKEIDLGGSYNNGNVTLKYRKNNSVDWQIASINADGTFDFSNILADGEQLEAIKIEYLSISKGFALSNANCIKLTGEVDESAQQGDLLTNKAGLTFEYQHYYYENYLFGGLKSDYVTFRVLIDTPWISALNKTKLTEGANYEHNPKSQVEFKIAVENDGSLGTGSFIKPIIVDLVPKGFGYVETWSVKRIRISDSSEKDLVEGIDYILSSNQNYDGEGNTLLTWSFNDDLEKGYRIEIKYDLSIKNTAIGGKHTNKLYLTSGTANQGSYWGKFGLSYILNNIAPDLRSDEHDGDIDGDINTIKYLEGSHTDIIVKEISSFAVSKWAKGSLDNDFTNKNTSPNVAHTVPGGSVDYKINIKNEGNVYGSWIEIVDILPYIGDTKVLFDDDRNSEWRPYFLIKDEVLNSSSNPTRPGTAIQLGINDESGDPIIAKVEVQFSTAFDPIRYGNGTKERTNPPGPLTNTSVGTEEPEWSTEIPDDKTRVQAIKFIISDFENANGLEPGEEINLVWNMMTPSVDETNIDSITYNKAAWNTASVHIEKNNVNGSKRMLFITEGPKAGIQLKKSEEQLEKGEIGNFVWFDKNENGIQDDGYDKESAGINDIKVKLYKKDGTLIEETLTGPEYSEDDDTKGIGNPGYYSFPNVPVDEEYYVEFYLPNYYAVTSKSSGTNKELDSDVNVEAVEDGGYIVVKTDVFELSSSNKIRRDIDLGLIPAANGGDGRAEISLVKEAIKYESLDNNQVNFNTPITEEVAEERKVIKKYPDAVNVGEKITYRVTIQNTGSVPLHNVLLEDALRGFNFNSIRILDNPDDPITEETPRKTIDDDPRVSNVQDSDSSLKLDKLNINEKYIFEGTYEVGEEDLRNPLTNTIRVWANELLAEPDKTPVNYARIADAIVEIANLSIDKSVSSIIKKDGSVIDASAVEGVGVEKGDTIVYRIKLHNTGSATLSNIDLNEELSGFQFANVVLSDSVKQAIEDDPRVKIISNTALTLDKLDADEIYTFEGTYIVPEDGTPGQPITNTVTANDDGNIRKHLSATTNVYYKGLQVTKKVKKINDIEVSDGDYLVAKVGDKIEYEITIKNDGDVPLKNITVQDIITSSKGEQDLTSELKDENGDRFSPINLEIDAIKTYTLVYEVSEADLASTGVTTPINNKVLVKSNYTRKPPIESEDVQIVHLDIDKSSDKESYYIGETVRYSIVVTNRGSEVLTNIDVVDTMLDRLEHTEIVVTGPIEKLEAGDSITLTGSYIITQEDLMNGKIDNIATADSHETEEVSDTCTVTVRNRPSGGGGGSKPDKVPDPEPEQPEQPEQPEEQVLPVETEVDKPQPEETEKTEEKQPEQEKETYEDTPVSGKIDVPENAEIKDGEEPSHGIITINESGEWEYTPDPGFTGTDSFSIIIVDENGFEDEIFIEIDVEEVPLGTIDELPKTGESDNIIFYILGLSLIFIGIVLRKRFA